MGLKVCVHTQWAAHDDPFTSVRSLKYYLQRGGVSIIQAAFAHSFFLHPEVIKNNPVYKKDRARSGARYPGKKKGQSAKWTGPNAREVVLDDNSAAQAAWKKYSGHPRAHGSGYAVRHIWGNASNPDMFTAGWNICYMPFWAGMLTEKQHQYPTLAEAVKQAAWELYFENGEVPKGLKKIVKNPKIDLESLLEGQPILILAPRVIQGVILPSKEIQGPKEFSLVKSDALDVKAEDIRRIKKIRQKSHRSWSDLRKAVLRLQKKTRGTTKVQVSAESTVRKIRRETELSLAAIKKLLEKIPDG